MELGARGALRLLRPLLARKLQRAPGEHLRAFKARLEHDAQ
jgi:hypothetical protein